MATSALSTNDFLDPTKHAEYPIILSDQLSGKDTSQQARLININYNYKTKSATAYQRSTITRHSKDKDLYNLTITDKAPNAEHLTYSYEGSIDPTQNVSAPEQNLVVLFDPDRKVFVLEPVSAQLNFNLRSSPVKSEKQAVEHSTQLKTLQNEENGSGDDRAPDGDDGDDSQADASNPYDYRHFLTKKDERASKPPSTISTPNAQPSTSNADSPLMPATTQPASTKPPPSNKQKPKPDANPLRQKKNTTKPAAKAQTDQPKPSVRPPVDEDKIEESKSSPSDAGSALSSQKLAPSPGSNIIIDGDLIIDMGSPPPSRTFKVNPAHFSSNNTPSNVVDDEDEMEHLRLPSPANDFGKPTTSGTSEAPRSNENEDDDDDGLAAEMEAAFEQSAREEEEARSQQYSNPPSQQHHIPSEDESEVSEEE